MTIRKIEAEIECDGCGKTFDIDLDAASNMKDRPLCDLIDDHIRGLPWCSIQGEHRLCRSCTSKVDGALPDEATPSRDEVAAILNEAAGV